MYKSSEWLHYYTSNRFRRNYVLLFIYFVGSCCANFNNRFGDEFFSRVGVLGNV